MKLQALVRDDMHRIWPPLAVAAIFFFAMAGYGDTDSDSGGPDSNGEELICAPANIAWPSVPRITEGTCESPWRYQRFGNCNIRDRKCGEKECEAGWKSCRSWSFGVDDQRSEPYRESRYTVDDECELIRGRPVCTIPAEGPCMARVNGWIDAAKDELPGDVRNLVREKPGARSVETTEIGNNRMGYRKFDVTCKTRLEIPRAKRKEHKDCGCRAEKVYPLCDLTNDEACGPSGTDLYSEPRLTETEAIAADGGNVVTDTDPAPQCQSCDPLPLSASAAEPEAADQAQAKYECLLASEVEAPDDATRAVVRKNKLLVYEMFGHLLTDSQQTDAELAYEAAPSVGAACGPAVTLPELPAACSLPMEGIRGTLGRCQRLLGQAVPAENASRQYLDCVDELAAMVERGQNESADADCAGAEHRQLLRRVVTQLYEKQSPVIEDESSELGAIGRQLYLLDQWYAAFSAAAELDAGNAYAEVQADLSFLVGVMWKRLHSRENAFEAVRASLLPDSPDPAVVESALDDAASRTRKVDQEVARALFTPVATVTPDGRTVDRPPLRGLPLLLLLGDALESTVRRAEDLAVLHDVACRFRDCRPSVIDTPLSRLWIILAALEDSEELASRVGGTNLSLVGWRDVFTAVSEHHSVLTAAIADVTGAGTLGDPREDLPRPVEALARRLRQAQTYAASYLADGQFDPTRVPTLKAGLDETNRSRVIGHVRQRTDALRGEVTEYRNEVVDLVRGLAAEVDTGATISRLENTKIETGESMDQLAGRIAGLLASADAEEARFGRLFEAFTAIEAALDANDYIQTGSTVPLFLEGADTLGSGPAANPALVAQRAFESLTGGKMLQIQTNGQYSPTCALRETRFLKPDGSGDMAVDTVGALTGPEGFTLAATASDYSVVSAASTLGATETFSYGVRGEVCAGGSFIGGSAKTCVYAGLDFSASASVSQSWQNGNEDRLTATFASGLRLANTPFPAAPVGALLLVMTDKTSGEIVDIHVMRSPSTMIPVPANANAYLVINDVACDTQDSTNTLEVHVRTLNTVGASAPLVVEAMSVVFEDLRAQQSLFVRQGMILPSQLAGIRSETLLDLEQRIRGPLTSYPKPLIDLFTAFLDKEITRLERAVEIRALEQAIDLIALEVRALDDDLAAAETRARLLSLLPRWSLQNLDGERLRGATADVLEVIRDYFHPILDLWYPLALDAIEGPALNRILEADVDSRVIDLASDAHTFAESVIEAYEDAQLGYKAPGEVLPVIAVGFPRPPADGGFDDFFGGGTGSGPESPWRKADAAVSQNVWNAIASRGVAEFTVSPEDIYSPTGVENGVLWCKDAVPVVRNMALYVIRQNAADNDTLNNYERFVVIQANTSQSFAAPEGPRVYELQNAIFDTFNADLLYGVKDTAINVFRTHASATRPVGLSPFGTFRIDFSALDTMPAPTGLDEEASEMVLVMELDSRQVTRGLDWIGVCQ